jgi:hypothetical protein
MRLLECSPDDVYGMISITKNLLGDKIPEYAILSHTWGEDTEEVTLNDIINGTGKEKLGYNKIRFCGRQAKRHGLQYFWIDTCCIDQSNSSEVLEAINSMFGWYRNAARCYVYLTDVPISDLSMNGPPSEPQWLSAFRASRWFRRGWTLQELLAPSKVDFFAHNGQLLGTKRSLEHHIYQSTGIAIAALRGDAMSQFSVDERWRWVGARKTTRDEDWAYCLLGIFGVFMPLIYGEGRENAIRRLKKEIRDLHHNDVVFEPRGVGDPNSASNPDSQPHYNKLSPRPEPWPQQPLASKPSGGSSCTCFTVCLQSLQALHNVSPPVSPPFDQVLSLNRKAVEGCASMLSCPGCMSRSGTHTAVMLLSTVIGKVTSLYKYAGQQCFESGNMLSSAAPSGRLSINIGDYTVNKEDGRWLELEILSRELRDLEVVYAQFRDVCGDLSEDPQVSKAIIGYHGQTLDSTLKVFVNSSFDM